MHAMGAEQFSGYEALKPVDLPIPAVASLCVGSSKARLLPRPKSREFLLSLLTRILAVDCVKENHDKPETKGVAGYGFFHSPSGKTHADPGRQTQPA
jgi:hypothetical protein